MMPKDPKLSVITTKDGSHSLLNEELNETYHSTHGALQEAEHVFIEHGLGYHLWQHPSKKEINILEIGFGTGLNAVLTFLAAIERDIKIHYTSLEPYPLQWDQVKELNYMEKIGERYPITKKIELADVYQKLHEQPFEVIEQYTSNFDCQKLKVKLEDYPIEEKRMDIIYYDAFAPSKQPEIWDIALLEKSVNALKEGGIWVTYCAQGEMKRNLKQLPLMVSTLPGPPGKKEMVRAIKSFLF